MKGVRHLADNRRRLLFVKKFFEEYTDENHGATMYDIQHYLKRCGIEAERKSITEDIYALQDYGMDIFWEEKEKQRRLRERDFELSELKMIIDCVASSKMLSEARSKELIEKLGKLTSVYERRTLERRVMVSGRAKTTNRMTMVNVDTINTAINCHEDIEFQYYQYNMKKEREYKHDGKVYHVNPKYLIYENNIYYMLADEKGELKTFRVDRMDNVVNTEPKPIPDQSFDIFSMTDEEFANASLEDIFSSLDLIETKKTLQHRPYHRRVNVNKEIDTTSFMKSTFGMFHGKKEQVQMLFTKEMMDVVIDKFGEDVGVEIVDDDHFRIKVDVAVSPQFYGWIFGLGQNVMIEFPLRVAKEMKDMLKERHKAYREEHSARIYYP